MPVPRPRFTVRRLMIAVAVVAVLLEIGAEVGAVLKRRESHFGLEGGEHRFAECMSGPGLAGNHPRQAAYYGRMAVKYEWAARYPFLPVWPDPPEPD